MWKALSADEQAPYLQRSMKMKEEIEAKKPPKAAGMVPTEIEGMRKKPMTPVFAFIQEKRTEIAAMPGISGLGQISKKGAELFKTLPAAEQEARTKKYEEELKAYNAWKESAEGQTVMDAKKSATAEKKAAKKEKEEKKDAKAARKQAREAKAANADADAGTAENKSPVKTGRKRASSVSPADKPKKAKGRGRGSKTEEPGVSFDPETLAEAQKCGLESAFKNLAGRKEMISSGKTGSEMLEALKGHGGLVNPAKNALLGA
jgi:hypothetical protein